MEGMQCSDFFGGGILSSQYLQNVLSSQSTNYFVALNAQTHFDPLITNWANGNLVQTKLSGSYAKGTAVKCSSDVDIFISLSPNLNMNLKEIYDSLFDHFNNQTYRPRKQNVSIRVNFNGNTIDLVPGRKQNNIYNDHSLYVKKRSTWTQTDVDKHISVVANSGRSSVIKLVKIWRERQSLEFPSLYLELATIRALEGRFYLNLDQEFRMVMTWFYNYIKNARFEDPANTANILSDDLTAIEKQSIAASAANAATAQNLNQVVW